MLHWELTAFEKRSIRTIYELIGQQVGIAGIGRVKLMEFLEDAMTTHGLLSPGRLASYGYHPHE
jgi:hypothetical protein